MQSSETKSNTMQLDKFELARLHVERLIDEYQRWYVETALISYQKTLYIRIDTLQSLRDDLDKIKKGEMPYCDEKTDRN